MVIPKLIQDVFQSRTEVFRKEVIIPHRMKLDLSLDTDVFAKGEDVFAKGEELKDTLLMLAEASLLLLMLQRQLFSTRSSSIMSPCTSQCHKSADSRSNELLFSGESKRKVGKIKLKLS